MMGRLLVALPLASFVLALAAWLRFGLDLPWYDDWRGFDGGWIASLSPAHLFTSINYTLSPVGLALDALAQRLLGGNAVVYQALSMAAVLGALLALQWAMLLRALGDRLVAAACFSLTVLMLQPGTYWGLENLAYHQALPLVFVGTALWLVLRGDGPARWRGPALAGLALLSGFSYISGAFGALAAGVTLLALHRWHAPARERGWRLREAAWFTAAAALATVVQFTRSFWSSHASERAIPIATPWHADFWWFYLGKIARSLMLPEAHPLASLLTMLAVVAAAAFAVARLLNRDAPPAARQVVQVLLPLAAMVAVYLALVTAGRARWRPDGMNAGLDIFAYAFQRFHHFWVTLLWPWVGAAVFVAARGRWRAGGAAIALAAVALFAWQGAFSHMAFQQERGIDRELALHCLRHADRQGGPIRCRGLLPPRPGDDWPDARPALDHARRIGASFVAALGEPPDGAPRTARTKLFDLDGSAGRLELQRLDRQGAEGFTPTADDPQMFLNFSSADAARCTGLELVARLRAARREQSQVYWGDPAFVGPYAERQSEVRQLEGGRVETISILLRSPSGFHGALRFDPVSGREPFAIESLKVYCVPGRSHTAGSAATP
jgi:hypothetical protein